MATTANLGLTKPATTDNYSVAVVNANMDLIDAAAAASAMLTKIKTVDGTTSGLDADLLDGLHSSAFATAAQGTLATNALPAASYTAADVLAKIKTVDGTGSGLDADAVDGLHFRSTSGYLEYSTDGSVWTPVGLITTKPRFADFNMSGTNAINTYYTVVDVAGKGRLNSIRGAAYSGGLLGSDIINFRVTIDGIAYVYDNTVSANGLWVRGLAGTAGYSAAFDVKTEFLTSMKVEVSQSQAANLQVFTAAVDYSLV